MELGIYLLKSAGILILFYGVYIVFLRKNTLFLAKRHYLLVGVIAALALPFVTITKNVYREIPVMTQPVLSDFTMNQMTNTVAAEDPGFSLSIWQILLAIYLLGLIVFAVRLIVQLLSLLRLVRAHSSERRGRFRFVKVNDNIAPFSFFNYIVYNPALHTAEELEMILKHEQVHAAQWHSADIIIGNLAQIVQWVNPISWIYRKSMEENLEFIADNETVSRISSKKQYQLALVKASYEQMAPALTNQFYQSFIKKRIIMLNTNASRKHHLWKLTFVLPFLALFLWSFNVKEVVHYQEVVVQEQPSVETTATETTQSVNEAESLADNTVVAETESVTQEVVEETEETESIEEVEFEEGAETEITETEEELALVKDRVMVLTKFKYKITKNTTNAELEAMKNELKSQHDIDMSYSVRRNNANEITSISLSYSGKDVNGSYNISEDDAIDEFEFFMDEDGRSGFYSAKMEERREERLARGLARSERRMEEMEERIARRELELAERMKDREEAREVEMVRRYEDLARRESEMIERRDRNMARVKKRMKEMKEREEKIIRDKVKIKNRTNSQGVFVYDDDYDFNFKDGGSERAVIIDKDTSDETLSRIKSRLKAKGISFSYSKLKRNSAGEITRIKVVTDSGNGNKSTISATADDGEPIETIIIEL